MQEIAQQSRLRGESPQKDSALLSCVQWFTSQIEPKHEPRPRNFYSFDVEDDSVEGFVGLVKIGLPQDPISAQQYKLKAFEITLLVCFKYYHFS